MFFFVTAACSMVLLGHNDVAIGTHITRSGRRKSVLQPCFAMPTRYWPELLAAAAAVDTALAATKRVKLDVLLGCCAAMSVWCAWALNGRTFCAPPRDRTADHTAPEGEMTRAEGANKDG